MVSARVVTGSIICYCAMRFILVVCFVTVPYDSLLVVSAIMS